MWKETTEKKENMEIFKEEFEIFLPEEIFDFHIHICPSEASGKSDFVINAAGNKLKEYGFEELLVDMKNVYPERKLYGVCFGVPDTKLNLKIMNDYVAEKCDGKNFFPFRIISPDEKESFVEKDIIEKKFYGFKPYRNFAEKYKKREEVEILDFLPEKFLKIANKYSLIITLHLPKEKRLADETNQEQLIYICEKYPEAKIVLAHIGRCYYFKCIYKNLEKLKNFKNLYYDLAMVNNFEVLEYLFKNVESKKILYGTDIPIALAGGKSVEINNQYTYITPVPWELSIHDTHKKIIFTSFIYEQLRAIKKAVERTGKGKKFLEKIFFKNGLNLLKEVKIK